MSISEFWCYPLGVPIRNVLFSHHLLFLASLVPIQERTTVMPREALGKRK